VLKTRIIQTFNTKVTNEWRSRRENIRLSGEEECNRRTNSRSQIEAPLTQADFAAQLQIAGITIERDSVSRIEIGTRFVADFELKVIAKVLNVSVDWLLSED
jgi:transcriptional regulator with XRE-family HTH domain